VVKVAEADLSALAGTWWSAAEDAIVRLTVKDAMLRVDGSPDPLLPIGDGIFRVNGPTGSPHEWRFSAPAVNAGASGAPASASTGRVPRELRITDAWPMPRLFTRLTAV
jgi:hypothetical protein